MPRRFILKAVKVNYTPSTPWMVRVPPCLQSIENAAKKFFEKESIAKAYIERLTRNLTDFEAKALDLSDSQKVEAAECFRLIGERKVLLADAVRHYVAHLEETNKSLSIGDLFDKFMQAKSQDGISMRYRQDLRSKLGRFAKAFNKEMACDLTTSIVETWLRDLNVGSVSRESYRRNISVLLEFGRRHGLLRNNPAADIKITRRVEGEVTILSTEELTTLLKHCAPEIVPYVAICAFAGLRPSETGNITWEDIHFETQQIEVKARHSKTRRYRLVPMQPNLVAWLKLHQRESGPIGYSRRKFREAYKAAGIDNWKMDVLRHSYGTYRLPIIKSADALALEMGNSPDIIFRHYRRPMNEATALTYFKVLPENMESSPGTTSPSVEDDKIIYLADFAIR